MPLDPASLAISAVSLLAGHFLPEAASAAVKALGGAAGKQVFDWLKSKLTRPAESEALAKLEANPTSGAARKSLEGLLELRLEKDAALVSELLGLLKSAGALDQSVTQTIDQAGDRNVGAQVSGQGNTVSLGKK
jgi:hypothetical protein